MARAFLCLILFFTTSAFAERENYSSPPLVLEEIKFLGTKEVLHKVYDTAAWSIWIIPGISSGDPKWITIGEELRYSADASASEDLNKAYSVALIRNPRYVLPFLKINWWSRQKACKFGWDSELPGGVRSYLEELHRVIHSLPDLRSSELGKECLEGVQESSAEHKRESPNQ